MQLNQNTVLLYAAKNYENPHCTSIDDFNQDIKRFVIARTLLRKYHKKGKIRIRLLLNHIIICTNTFGNEAATKLLLYYCESELWGYLASFFEFLHITPINFNAQPDKNISEILQQD